MLVPLAAGAAGIFVVTALVALAHASNYRYEYGSLLNGDVNGPHDEAHRWIEDNLDPESFIVIDSTFLIDLREADAPGDAGGFDRTYHYWIVDRDPGVRTRLLKDDWRNVDYVVSTESMAGDMNRGDLPFVSSVLRHANPIAAFGEQHEGVQIYAVNHFSARDDDHGAPPAVVPSGATEVRSAFTLDRAPATAGASPDRPLFFAGTCADSILSIVVSDGVLYAEIPCDQFAAFDGLEGQPVGVHVEVADPIVLSVGSNEADQASLVVGRVWYQPIQREDTLTSAPTGAVTN
jgi:hypothetical protein